MELDSIYRAITTVWGELMSFGLVLCFIYVIWLVVSAIVYLFNH